MVLSISPVVPSPAWLRQADFSGWKMNRNEECEATPSTKISTRTLQREPTDGQSLAAGNAFIFSICSNPFASFCTSTDGNSISRSSSSISKSGIVVVRNILINGITQTRCSKTVPKPHVLDPADSRSSIQSIQAFAPLRMGRDRLCAAARWSFSEIPSSM